MIRRVLTGAVVGTVAVATATIGATTANAATSSSQAKTFDRMSTLAQRDLARRHVDTLIDPEVVDAGGSNAGSCSTANSPIISWVTNYEKQKGWSSDDIDTINQLEQFAEVYALRFGDQSYGTNGQYTSTVKSELTKLQGFWKLSRNTSSRGWHSKVVFNHDDMVQLAKSLGDDDSQAEADATAIVNAANSINGLTPNDPLLTFNSVSASDTGTIAMGDGITDVYGQNGFDATEIEQFIMGHEFGHQVQFDTNYNPNPAYGLETGADAASGYFVKHAKGLRFSGKKINDVAKAAYDIGDCQHSHGTPEQRQASTKWGAQTAGDQTQPVLSGQQFITTWDKEFHDKIVPMDTVPSST